MEFLAECYANTYVAKKLSQMLNKKLKQPSKVRHSYKQGRDRIIKEIISISKRKDRLTIAVIDYEKGISRKFIDVNFELSKIDERILIGISKHGKNAIAIVFDPDIEEAFICRISRELCEDIFQFQKLKSRKAYSAIREFIGKPDTKRILNTIVEKLVEIIQRITSSEKSLEHINIATYSYKYRTK